MRFPGGAGVGDAVVSPRPFTARATSKAAQDALALASSLERSLTLSREANVPDHYGLSLGLQDYQSERLPRIIDDVVRVRTIDQQIGMCSADRYRPLDEPIFDDEDPGDYYERSNYYAPLEGPGVEQDFGEGFSIF